MKTFLIERNGMVRVTLRRFASGTKCSKTYTGCHDAKTFWKNEEAPLDSLLRIEYVEGNPPRNSPFWPQACPCGYLFRVEDEIQVFNEYLYCSPLLPHPVTLAEAPPGSMWSADWHPARWKGPDGLSLCVKLPTGHDWFIDAPSFGGGEGWTRLGTPPAITVKPSIRVPGRDGEPDIYHGFLTNGVFVPA
jgi:hypothetical protein